MLEKLQIIKQRFDEVSDLIIQPDVISDQKRYIALNKEYKDLRVLVSKSEEYKQALDHLAEAEKIMQEIEVACKNKEFGVIVIDSLAAMVPREMLKKEIGEMTVGALSKMMSICLPRISSLLKESKTVLIFINQLREVIGANKWEDAEKTPGGRYAFKRRNQNRSCNYAYIGYRKCRSCIIGCIDGKYG